MLESVLIHNILFPAFAQVVLAGGCARTPKVRQMLDSYFNGKAEILSSISPEEVIATGACLQVSVFCLAFFDILLLGQGALCSKFQNIFSMFLCEGFLPVYSTFFKVLRLCVC